MAEIAIDRLGEAAVGGDDEPVPSGGHGLLRWAPWRSPVDQPGYARPALLLIVAVAAVSFAWGIEHAGYRTFYADAARSMSESWRGFLFGSFDPGNSITLDKIPGFLWPQALSARIFGFHPWALELPQVIEGLLCVLVLYRVVRIWVGVPAALLSAAAFTLTPVTAGVFRAPAEDAAFTLLLLLAAEACQRATHTARLRTLVACGVWVGLAFQAKMLEAWVALPALAITYVIAAPASRWRRLAHLAVAGAVMTAVSASWIVVVTVTPAKDRPYIDGSTNNSAFGMVVGYNFLNRFGSVGLSAEGTGSVTSTQGHRSARPGSTGRNSGGSSPGSSRTGENPGPTGRRTTRTGLGAGPVAGGAQGVAPGVTARWFGGGSQDGWNKMVAPAIASETGWLYPLAVIALVLGLTWRRREPRLDRLRAGYLLWGVWLIAFFVVFSAGSVGNHMYYMGVVDVALAALAGASLVACWEAFRAGGQRAAALPVAVTVTVAWDAYLTGRFPAFLSWLAPAVIGLGAIALVLLVMARRPGAGRLALAGLAAAAAATLIGPGAWASLALTSSGRGSSSVRAIGTAQRPGGGNGDRPSAGVRGRASVVGRAENGSSARSGFGDSSGELTTGQRALLTYLRAHRDGARYLFAVADWNAASPYILGAGVPVLPMGGFTGQVPFPTLQRFQQLVDHGDLHYVMLIRGDSGSSQLAAITSWVNSTCTVVPASAYGGSTPEVPATRMRRGDAAASVQQLYRCR